MSTPTWGKTWADVADDRRWGHFALLICEHLAELCNEARIGLRRCPGFVFASFDEEVQSAPAVRYVPFRDLYKFASISTLCDDIVHKLADVVAAIPGDAPVVCALITDKDGPYFWATVFTRRELCMGLTR